MGMILLAVQPPQVNAEEVDDILVLSTYPATSIGSELLATFINEMEMYPGKRRYYVEHLYTNHQGLRNERDSIIEELKKKYKQTKIDVVVAIGNDAFSILDLEDLQQKEIPFFIGSIDYEILMKSGEEDSKKISCAYGNSTVIGDEQIQLMKQVQPKLKTVYWICEHQNQQYPCPRKTAVENISIEYIHMDELDRLDTKVIKRKSTSYAMMLSYIGYNKNGADIYPQQYLEEISKYYPGPIYFTDKEIYKTVMGSVADSGQLMGGVMRDRAYEVKVLAKQVAYYLLGSEPAKPLLVTLSGQPSLNWNSIVHYGLDMTKLKQQYAIEYRDRHELLIPKDRLVQGLVVVLFGLVGLMILLSLSIRHSNILTKQLKQDKMESLLLLSILPQGVLQLVNNRLMYINSYGKKMLGIKDASDFIGKPVQELINFDIDLHGLSSERSMVTIDGREVFCGIQVITKEQEKQSLIVLMQDLTKQKRLREKRYYHQIRKDVFAHLSHDIRTPIQVILSALQMMEVQYKQKLNQSHLDILRQNSYRLLRLVNNLIDSTKLEDKKLTLHLQLYNIVYVTEDLIEQVATTASKLGFTIIFDPQEEEIYGKIDRDKYERCLLNILSNALKYSSPTEAIIVHMECQQDVVVITIKSFGQGIGAHLLEGIFEPFVQQDKSSTRIAEGSGLGLAVVRELIELHEGHVRMVSKEERYIQAEIFLFREWDIEKEERLTDPGIVNQQQVQVELSDLDV